MDREMKTKTIIRQGLLVLFCCALIELGAGQVLAGMENEMMVLIPGLVIIIPPLVDLRGNISGALASRLGTSLHVGSLKPKLRASKELKVNFVSSIILTVIASALIGLLSAFMGFLTGVQSINLLHLLEVALLAGILSGLILTLLTILIAVTAYSREWDPDIVTGPLTATLGDFITILCVYLTIAVVV